MHYLNLKLIIVFCFFSVAAISKFGMLVPVYFSIHNDEISDKDRKCENYKYQENMHLNCAYGYYKIQHFLPPFQEGFNV